MFLKDEIELSGGVISLNVVRINVKKRTNLKGGGGWKEQATSYHPKIWMNIKWGD